MSNTTIRVVTESKELESLVGIWDSLLHKCREDNSIYLTHDWVSTWWKYFGEGKKLNILLIEKGCQLIGIVPLMKVEYGIGPFKLPVLETIGATNCNYGGLILSENREEVITAFLAYLREELNRNKIILRLRLVPEDSKFLEVLRQQSALFSKNFAIKERVTTLAPYIRLPVTWDEYFASLSRKRRQILRQASKSLTEEHIVEYQQYGSDSLEEGLNTLFDLHQRRWQSVNIKSMFSDPKMREFYRDIAARFLKKNWLHFSYLAVDNEIVCAVYAFIYNQKYYGATVARAPQYSEYNIGHLHHMYLVKDAIRQHLQEFDFLKGDEPYKFYWTKSFRRYIRVTIIRNSFFSVLRLRFLNAFLHLCWVSQNSLREIYSLYLLQRRREREKKRMGLLKWWK